MLCALDFAPYPFDSHVCNLKISNQNDPVDLLVMEGSYQRRKQGAIENVLQYDIEYAQLNKDEQVQKIEGAEFSVVGVKVHMKRQVWSRNCNRHLHVLHTSGGFSSTS